MSKEIWKPIPSRPGMLASSLGRVQVLPYEVITPFNKPRTYAVKPTFGHIRKSSKTARHKYFGLSLRRFGNMKIHRLVCEAFHGPEPSKLSVVIHINECATDNRPNNLRWGTQRENLNMPGFVAYCKSRTGLNSPVTKGKLKKITK
jgi:hypothetical protein